MKTLKNFYTGFLQPRTLHILLALSVLTNIIFVLILYYPDAIDNLRDAMESPPAVLASDHILGRPDAKVTVIVYSDFQCPYCARFDASVRSLISLTGTRVIYRHFPLDFHPQAEQSAEAAECAGDQGKFWEYGEELFASGKKLEDKDRLGNIASNLGLDMKAFDTCLSSGKFKQRVAEQREEGMRRRIRVTPTFYVNGKRFLGALPDDQLKQLLVSSGT